MNEKSRAYWIDRVARYNREVYDDSTLMTLFIEKEYNRALESIQQELIKITTAAAKEGELSLSAMYRKNRLEKLEKKYKEILQQMTKNIYKNSAAEMVKGSRDIYANIIDAMGLDFEVPNKKFFEQLLLKPWLNGNFSARLWGVPIRLNEEIHNSMVQGLIQGKSVAEISATISKALDKGYNITNRLVRTETMHLFNESAYEGYKAAGCEKVEIYAAEDERTCKTCGKEHKKEYTLDKRPLLPFHPHCRCTYLPVMNVGESKLKNAEKLKKEEEEREKNKNKTWSEVKLKDKHFKNKEEMAEHLLEKHGIEFKDSKAKPLDPEIFGDFINWLDTFTENFSDFDKYKPVQLPEIKNLYRRKLGYTGCYTHASNRPACVGIKLNASKHVTKEYAIAYNKYWAEEGWHPPNSSHLHTLIHEFGHYVSDCFRWHYAGGDENWDKKLITEAINRYNKETGEGIEFADLETLVSGYAVSQPWEAVAESFAEYFEPDIGVPKRKFCKVFGQLIEEKLKGMSKK